MRIFAYNSFGDFIKLCDKPTSQRIWAYAQSSTLCEKVVLTTLSMEYCSCILFLFRIGCVFPTTAMLCRRAHRACWYGSWSWNTIIGSVSLLQLVMLFQDAQRTIYTCFSMPVCVGTNTDIETKRTRPPEVIFTHHLPEALQNYFNCAKISTKKRSHKSVKMVRSSFGRMPVGCSNNRLCYGSIFYF